MPKKWKIVLLVFFSLIVLLVAAGAFFRMQTKKHSPLDTVGFESESLNLKIVYSRPYKKGRVIFGPKEAGAIQPYGVYWRMGANDATTIEVSSDITFAGKPLKAGKYSIYAYPGESEWKININSESNRWALSEPAHKNDVLTVMVPVTYSNKVIDQFTIMFEPTNSGVDMALRWDTSVIRIPIN